MSEASEDDLAALQKRIAAAREQLNAVHLSVRSLVERLEAGIVRVTESWSGSFAGYHARLYYRDFQRPAWNQSFNIEWGGINGPQEGWCERTPDEVKRAIETIGGAEIATVEQAADSVAGAIVELRDDVAIALAPIRQLPALAAEAKMLDALEKMPLRIQLHDYLNANIGGIRTRDSRAAMQGIVLPAHVYYEGQLAHATSVFQKGDAYLRAADRLVRQVHKQQGFFVTRQLVATDAAARVVRLCERFHQAALRLRTRKRGRSPFEIKDEHDVQDLLDALLQVDFDDVRREEDSPSHAGSSPAIDFLLKAEQLGVEVKMWRESMTPKALGDELLADIGRYAEHPDCRTLVCFVYDPEGRLTNPRGLERDLEKQSRGSLRVIAVIAPR